MDIVLYAFDNGDGDLLKDQCVIVIQIYVLYRKGYILSADITSSERIYYEIYGKKIAAILKF